MITVEVPGVGAVEFPDGTAPEVMTQALARYRRPAEGGSRDQIMARMQEESAKRGGMQGAVERSQPYNRAAEYGMQGGDGESYIRAREAIQDGGITGSSGNSASGKLLETALMSTPGINLPFLAAKAGSAMMGGGGDGMSAGDAGVQGLNQGLTFGFGDEAAAGLASLTGDRPYDQNLAISRAMLDAGRADQPAAAYGGEIAGAMVAPGAMMGAAKGAGIGARMLTGAGLGATQGSLYGFGAGEGGTGERLNNSFKGGLLGGIVGGAAPVAISGALRGGRAIRDVISGMFKGADATKASEAIANVLARSGQSADDVRTALSTAAREGQPEYSIVDAIGRRAQRTLGSAYRMGDEAQDFVSTALRNRQDAQGRRVGGFISDALGVNQTASGAEDALTAARRVAANPAYEAARASAKPVNLNDAIGTVDDLLGRDPILGETALSRTEIGRRLMAVRDQMTKGGEQLIDFDTVLNVKQDLYQQMQANPRVAAQMRPVYTALDDALEAASGAYRAANDDFARASRVIDAVDEGKSAFGPRVRASDVAERYRNLTPDEASAFRTGYSDPLLAKVENAPLGTNRVRPLRADGTTDVMAEIANDPALLARRLMREDTMFETAGKTLGGSDSGERIADDFPQATRGIIDNIVSGKFGAAAKAAGWSANLVPTVRRRRTLRAPSEVF
jgi:hypothetical protein